MQMLTIERMLGIVVVLCIALSGCNDTQSAQSHTQIEAYRPALQGIMRVRLVDPIDGGGARKYLKAALPNLDTDGGENDFVLAIRIQDAGGEGAAAIRRVEYYYCRVVVYRDDVVEGRRGKFVVYEDVQPRLSPGAVKGRDLVAEVALRGFIRDWHAANSVSSEDAPR